MTTSRMPVSRNAVVLLLSVAIVAACTLDVFGAPARRGKPTAEELEKKIADNMARMPEADPPATEKVTVREAMRGVHPRLLLTKQEFVELATWAEKDPIVKLHAQAVLEGSQRVRVSERSVGRMFNGATPALVTAYYGLPNLAMAHGLEPNDARRQGLIDLLKIMVDRPYWDTAEFESGMGGAACMFMAGLAFDMVADGLEPEVRTKAARVLFEKARRMYHLGHMENAITKTKYWQQDPQNNHRWHRNAGLVSCLLAVADEPGIDSAWMLQKVRDEMDFVMKWYPDEGDCHESVTYSSFGFSHLAVAAWMMDRVLGTEYLEHPGLKNCWKMMVYSWSPPRRNHLSFGDSGNGIGRSLGKTAAFFIGPRLSRDPAAQAAMTWLHDAAVADNGGDAASHWNTLVFYDPTLEAGSIDDLPPVELFEDLGVVYLRDSWRDDAPLMMFKCGPHGGYKLNAYRHSFPEKPQYINVAHDDPDANTFAMVVDGGLAPHPSKYDNPKLTANHNTILVDGSGQSGEGKGWMQPIGDADMRTLQYLTGWKQGDGGRVIVEGEAGNLYPYLKGFRRTVAWMPGQYVLILDSVTADGEQKIEWNAISHQAEFTNPDEDRAAFIADNGARLDYQIRANRPLKAAIDYMKLMSPKGNTRVQQTRFFQTAGDIRYACLLNPWKADGLSMTMTEADGTVTVNVRGPAGEDVWTWRPAGDLDTPSSLAGTRDGKELIELTKENVAPRGEGH